MRKNQSWPNFRHYSGIFVETLSKTTARYYIHIRRKCRNNVESSAKTDFFSSVTISYLVNITSLLVVEVIGIVVK